MVVENNYFFIMYSTYNMYKDVYIIITYGFVLVNYFV
jgi:hypothetical protein